MRQVPLSPLPNQAIAFNADGAYWQIRIFQSINFMCADVRRNGNYLIQGVRCFAGTPVLPYSYMYEPNFGNFLFDNTVDWELFGSDTNLFYLSNDELKQYEALEAQ